MINERADIEAAVKTYLDGLYEGDADKLASVFHPTSALTSEQNGVLTVLPREEWLTIVRGRASAISQGLERREEILQIDQSSPITAFVKLKCQLPPRYFTDYLCFLKIDGKWKVAQKIFATEVRK